jgi:hypothetical protein
MTPKTRSILRLTGFLLGGLLAAALLLSGRMPESGAAAGARLTIDARPTAELGVSPAGRDFLTARNLQPGGPEARGELTVSAYARGDRSAHLRAAVEEPTLDDLVRLEITAAGRRLFHGKLAELRRWTRRGLEVTTAETYKVHFSAWIPASAQDGYQGRSSELTLEWRTRKANR